MDLVLEKFVIYFTDIYGHNDERFVEAHGRKFFLLYLKPIINGVGNYYIEAQTRDSKRTDVIIDYLGQQFIVELKIWHGNEYHERGEEENREKQKSDVKYEIVIFCVRFFVLDNFVEWRNGL